VLQIMGLGLHEQMYTCMATYTVWAGSREQEAQPSQKYRTMLRVIC